MSKIHSNIRRSQLITTWGIGQMIDLPGNDSLMLAGLEAWERHYGRAEDLNEFVFNDSRLSRRLGVKNFRLPPEYRRKERFMSVINPGITLPFVRFPLWYYCPNCGYMHKQKLRSSRHPVCERPNYKIGRSCHSFKYPPSLVPVRFVAACDFGHLEDFPFHEWVHKGKTCKNARLRWTEGKSPDLGGIWISCTTCGESKSLLGITNPGRLDKIKTCSGNRPWMGEVNNHSCDSSLVVVQKGATNLYFPLIKTSIYIPVGESPKEKRITQIIEKPLNWDLLTISDNDGNLNKDIINQIAKRFNENPDDIESAVLDRLNIERNDNYTKADKITETEFRQYEYNFFLSQSDITDDEIVVENVPIESYNTSFKTYFTSIKKIKKLRETMAFCGFSRLNPPDGAKVWDYKREISNYKVGDWLPAVWSRGEGLFLQFNVEHLTEWLSDNDVFRRAISVLKDKEKFTANQDVDSAFIMMHTFSHLLMNRLSYSCGYGSSSLRERIYYSNKKGIQMAGLLIYATGDSEGTLGGLVRMAEPMYFESMINKTIQDALWCSSDPLCIDSMGQGPESCNLAACHNCAVTSETSCESANRFLDRKLLIGGPISDTIALNGFFENLKVQI